MDRCVVRHPIKEASTDKIIGYELLFQPGSEGFYDGNPVAAADTISSFLMNNSGVIFKDKPIFITVTPTLLFRNTPKMFEKDMVIIQIEDNLVVHPLAMPIIKKYCEQGYKFAINNFQFSPKYVGLLEYASYIRLNVNGKSVESSLKEKTSLENILKIAHGLGKECIGTGIETKDEYDFAKDLGVDYLEGDYIAETLVVKTSAVDYMQGSFFRLVVAVSKEEPDLEEIEAIVSRDAGLTYALLKLVNSAFFALRRRTASIRQALMTLGIGQLRQWVYILGFNSGMSDGSEELLKISFLRAKFASDLSALIKIPDFTKSDGYLMGMFSTIKYMVDAPMEEILAEIPISNEIKEALLNGGGKAGKILELILSYEKADWKTSSALAQELGIAINRLGQLYIDCVESVNEIWASLTTDYDRPGETKIYRENDGKEHLEDILR